jgi:hypothetical protein
MREAALSGFSVLFTQSPSFLSHQELLQRQKGSNNAAKRWPSGVGRRYVPYGTDRGI